MFNGKRIIAIIPARGGSKRLPRKNILNLAGKPLISWSIEAGLKSNYVDKVVVTTDDDEILNIAQQNGADVIKRPKELASDSALTFDAIKHVLENFYNYDYAILLQPTSPLRDHTHIDQSISIIGNRKANAVISVCEVDHSPLWSNSLPDDLSMVDFLKDNVVNKRSQDLPTYYRLNGAIYIGCIKSILEEEGFFLKENIYAYLMQKEHSVDIDTELDFKFVEFIMQSKYDDNINHPEGVRKALVI